MTEYVLGFLFKGDQVLLIRKARPAWQSGRLNGVGGHIEAGETPIEAMEREFLEECGLKVHLWHHFCVFFGEDFKVYMFCSHCTADIEPQQCTDEAIEWHQFRNLPALALPNLYWIIPMALSFGHGERSNRFLVEQI